ncbi:transcriptional regulator, TetR family [Reichenbachiella faecimaris]|uniref:Transcriptional regulator, TetR family n=1 Tax=Reichenbachiella faecimaris TaxID=692418 RepID=A0A1W2G6E2_REIFA|nr:TetR/AcrR family transcriptional regulator [Reichenbachiella faecimaris]SMD32249.1 transcriptional regulator, TetR family [Reichenbachiella faecimaris]
MGRDGKPTRAKILTESKNLVLQNGFAGTTIDQILGKTGITKGAFFYHFKSKSDLAKALIEEYIENDKAELAHALKDTEAYISNPFDRLLHFVQWFIDLLTELEEIPGCLYASYSYEPSHFNDDIKKYISESILMWRGVFNQMLTEVLKSHTTKMEIDTKSLADHFVVILEGSFIVSKAINRKEISAKQLKHFKNYLEIVFEQKT